MIPNEVKGKLFIRYLGDEYPEQDYQIDILLVTKDSGEQFFEFEFEFPKSPTKEKVVFSVNEENKKRVINPFNLQYMLVGENDWILIFEIIEEFEDDTEYFSAYARFKTEYPILKYKRFLHLF